MVTICFYAILGERSTQKTLLQWRQDIYSSPMLLKSYEAVECVLYQDSVE